VVDTEPITREVDGDRATSESEEEDTAGANSENIGNIIEDELFEDGQEAEETTVESRRSHGFNPPLDAEMSSIIDDDVDQSNYEIESIHGHGGSNVSGIDPRTFPLQATT
jgi:hypothetical protein